MPVGGSPQNGKTVQRANIQGSFWSAIPFTFLVVVSGDPIDNQSKIADKILSPISKCKTGAILFFPPWGQFEGKSAVSVASAKRKQHVHYLCHTGRQSAISFEIFV